MNAVRSTPGIRLLPNAVTVEIIESNTPES